MAVPKKRATKARRNKRRSHHALSRVHLVACKNCGHKIEPHVTCDNCGLYRGKQPVIDVLKKLSKRERKAKEQELEEQQETVAPQGPLDPKELSQG